MAELRKTRDVPNSNGDVSFFHNPSDDGRRERIAEMFITVLGRPELVRAAREIAREVSEGRLDIEDIDEVLVSRHLYTQNIPDPDLVIRTSGEVRISNFLIWQAAYSEIWVTDVLWPDFRKETFYRAILDYQQRERRFGRVR